MEQSGCIVLTHKINDKEYKLLLPMGVPFNDAHDAALTFVGTIAKMAADTAAQQEEEKKKQESLEPEIVNN